MTNLSRFTKECLYARILSIFALAVLFLTAIVSAPAQSVVPVGAGSYASFPPPEAGTDASNFLASPIYVTADAQPPYPSSKWWTDLIVSKYAGTMWAYPLCLSADANGVNIAMPTAYSSDGTSMVVSNPWPVSIRGIVAPAPAPTDILIADFEGSTNYPAGWTTTGTAFGSGPATGPLTGQSGANGFIGSGFANSFHGGDGSTGTLTSTSFVLSRNFINFLVAGGNTTNTAIQLIVSNVVVRTTSGVQSENFAWAAWDVSALAGQTATIRLYDNATGGWGHIMGDQFYQSNSTNNPGLVWSTLFSPVDARAKNWSDWLVTMQCAEDTNRFMNVTAGHGLPYVWAECTGVTPQLNLQTGATFFNDSGAAVTFPVTTDHVGIAYGSVNYAVFAPDNTVFTYSNNVLSMAFANTNNPWIAVGGMPATNFLSTFNTYAYAIPRTTTLNWAFDAEHATVHTTWTVAAQALKGSNTNVIQGWIPHHYRTTTNNLSFVAGLQYLTPRGQLKCTEGSSFNIDYPFHGLLPVLPAPVQLGLTNDYNPSRMGLYVSLRAGQTNYGNETYFGGIDLWRYGQYLNFATQMGRPEAATLQQTLHNALSDWFTWTPGETAHFFGAYPSWGALIGFDSSYYSYNFTDNHFHYGYFTMASALLGMQDKQFVTNYGGMATLVCKQYANWDRSDTNFPFLRTFDIWCGHSDAGGTSSPGGNNQESSSEGIQSWVGQFLLGNVLGNTNMAACGAMGYSMETQAELEYYENYYGWRDGAASGNFSTNYVDPYTHARSYQSGILFDSGQAWATYFSGDPAWEYGIHWIQPSACLNYLAQDPVFSNYQYTNMMAVRNVWSSSTNWNVPTFTNTISQMGAGLGDDILGYVQLFNPGWVASQLDMYWASGDPIATDNAVAGLTYYNTHANRLLGSILWNWHASLPCSQIYYNSNRLEYSYAIYNPGSTYQLANIYSNNVVLGQVLVGPGALVRATNLLTAAGSGFQVIGTSPVNGITNVAPPVTQVAVVFSTNVDVATLSTATISGPVVSGLSLISGTNSQVAVFSITGTVQVNQNYTVTIPAAASSVDDSATLGTPYIFSFMAQTPPSASTNGSYLLGHWRLDETSGSTAADATTNHNDGTYYNPTLGQPGAFPITTNAVLFNGTNSYVALPYSYTLGMLGDFTAMAWVNPANANGSLPVFGTDSTTPDQGLQLMVQGGKVYFGFYADDSVGVGAITNNGWQHIVWRYHNGEQAIFINGQLDSFDGGHAPFGGLAPVLIGRSSVGLGSTNNLNSARYFNGLIDDAQIYGRALTDVEILYQYQHPGYENTNGLAIFPVGNKAPVVSAGANQVVNYTNTTVGLSGYVSDDGNPNPPSLVTSLWTKVSGPGTVTFGNAAQTNTTATFSSAGTYVLQLTANDSALTSSNQVTISLYVPYLSGHYRLDETSGTVAPDSSPNHNDGTWIGAPVFSQTGARTGTTNSISFNNSTYAQLPSAVNMGLCSNDFTAMAWVNPANGNDQSVFGTDSTTPHQGLQLLIRGSKAYMDFYGDATTGSTNVPTGQWTHIAWRFHHVGTNYEQVLFVNGQVDKFSINHQPFTGTGPLLLGRWGLTRYFQGLIDDAQVYSRALLDAEVLAAYNNPGTENTNGPQTVPQETRPPTITLNGGSPMSIMVGTSFTDPGAVGADCYGNVLPVTTSGSVNTGVAGTNTLTYVTTDEFSVTVTNTRIVAVVSKVMISLDYGPSGSTVPAPAGFTKVLYAGGGAAGNMTVSNAGGSPYTLVCTNIKAYNGGGSGSTLDKDGLYTSAGATAGFSLTGLQTNLPVGLWACYGWDGTGKGANVVWAGATNSLTTAESVTSPGTNTMQYLGTATSDVNGTVSGTFYGSATTEGQVGAMIYYVAGSVTVTVTNPPFIGKVYVQGGQLFFAGTNGTPGATYRVLVSTNLATPMAGWTPVATNPFGADASFAYTNSVTPGGGQEFYRMVSP